MSHWHCTSTTRMWRLRWLSGLAGAALLSAPALAEDGEAVEPSTQLAESDEQAAQLSETAPVQTVAAIEQCAPVQLASVQAIAPAAPPVNKAAAILGGEISSLDRIRMAQSGIAIPPVASAPAAMATDLVNATGQSDTLAPYDAPTALCHQRPSPIADVAPSSDDRLILGSLRLSISKTPFDLQWSKVSKGGAGRGLKRWLAQTGAYTEADPRGQLAAVNRWVNNRIAYTDDSELYRQSDFWASSRETLRRRKGDCEDYAILKMDLLAAMGIDRDRMILVVARDLVRNADHAVLVVKLEQGGSVMLDNSTDTLLDGRLANDYRPIMSFASNGKWLHGYAIAEAAPQPAPVATIAAVSVPSTPAIALLAPASTGN
jgi:predicted transglutaminase-like cysteine proteinase